MAISLYDISVRGFLQTLDAISGFLDKSLAHCRDNDIHPAEIVEARLFTDMRPFRFQIQRVVYHSQGAVEGIMSGTAGMPGAGPDHDYGGLQALIVDARTRLRKLTPQEVDAREGADLVFQVGDAKRVFTAEGFLMSFSLPNFHFHATTAYDILRSKGVPVGKLDYIGALRLKG